MQKLATACKNGDTYGIYTALRDNMARRLDTCDSGRDFAAIAKSFIQVVDKLDELEKTRALAKKKPSAVRAAQRKFKVA